MNINCTNEKTLQGLKLSNFFHVKERRFVNAVKEKISNVILEKLQKQELFTLCEIEFDNDFTELESLSNEKKMILSVFHETEVENNILPIYISLHLFTKNLRMYLFNRTLLKEQIARFFTYEEKFFYEMAVTGGNNQCKILAALMIARYRKVRQLHQALFIFRLR